MSGFGESFTYDVDVAGNHAYVASGEAGLKIVEIRPRFPQALEFHLPAEVLPQDPLAVPAVTADSGLPVTLSAVSGPAIVVGNQLTWTGLGPVTIRADQAGDSFFRPVSAKWTVNVIPRRLGARLAGPQVELFWATGVAGLQLQSRFALAADGPWQNVTNASVETAGEARVRVDAATPLRYFRLLQP